MITPIANETVTYLRYLLNKERIARIKAELRVEELSKKLIASNNQLINFKEYGTVRRIQHFEKFMYKNNNKNNEEKHDESSSTNTTDSTDSTTYAS